jgi:hypothetical protein
MLELQSMHNIALHQFTNVLPGVIESIADRAIFVMPPAVGLVSFPRKDERLFDGILLLFC